VDIGANTGVYSILAAANNSDSTVIAIEPVPLNYALLSKNIRANHKSIKSFMIAISDKAGKANMYMLKGQINYMTSVNKNRYLDHPEIQNGAKMEEVTIAVKPFSYVVKKMNLSKIDLLKVDVEGHEIAVFSSMLDIIKNSQPAIIVEVITQEIADYLQSIFELLPYTFIKINETEPSKIVSKIIEDNHCNFLLCPNKRLKEIEHKLLAN
jgi:FkbM family methyltransferase